MLAEGALGSYFLPLFLPVLKAVAFAAECKPLLLENFSSKDEGVREAAEGASRAVMRNLSPHGVKLVLPKVLEGLKVGVRRGREV